MPLRSYTFNITKNRWISIALLNLVIVATLGFLLRSKAVFAIPFISYTNFLHAHSHYAFAGWLTLLLMVLMVYELLGQESGKKRLYQNLILANALTSLAMLISFMLYGYHAVSIIFSTLFTFNTYAFSYFFIRDIRRADVSKPVYVLSVSALVFLVISSIAPYYMGYLSAIASKDFILFKDAVYSYLHLQYNGFFTLAVLALFFHRLKPDNRYVRLFSYALIVSVPLSIVHNYLWHEVPYFIKFISVSATLSLLIACYYLIRVCVRHKQLFYKTRGVVRYLAFLSLLAFFCKIFFPALLLSDTIAGMVYMNKGIVIGFLHLILLMFISLYLLKHLAVSGYFNLNRIGLRLALFVFATAVWLNEVVLFAQGLLTVLAIGSRVFLWLLWITALFLLLGAALIYIMQRIRIKSYQWSNKKYQYKLIKI